MQVWDTLKEVSQPVEKSPFYTMAPEEVLEILGTGPGGLSGATAAARLEEYGPNELAHAKKISPLVIFFRQFANLLMLILLAAIVISYLAGESLDAVVILAILLACVVLGFIQEYRAEKAAAALARSWRPRRPRSSGRAEEITIPSPGGGSGGSPGAAHRRPGGRGRPFAGRHQSDG